MKTFILSLLLALAAAPLQAKGLPVQKPQEKISAAAAYTVPAGWTISYRTEQGDAQAILEKDMHIITIRLAGEEKSRYKRRGDFLAGMEARSHGGKRAEKLGGLKVAGQNVMIYRREIIVSLPPPGELGPSTKTEEEFCTVQAGKRFFILSYSYGDSIPDPTYNGLKAWRGLLKSFKIKR
ncbi:MAG: hypothetical protein AUJ51_03810 [Elusimicrobia bacterium CG1_02_56_21]|nr:MAG: hypothetical protein AUJ51_03810 [Elusimicrobia bacterium CG1_02_56_21]